MSHTVQQAVDTSTQTSIARADVIHDSAQALTAAVNPAIQNSSMPA
jgi:hypothetical protein